MKIILFCPYLFLDPFYLFYLNCVVPDVTQRTVTLETLSEEHAIVSVLPTLHLSQVMNVIQTLIYLLLSLLFLIKQLNCGNYHRTFF